MDSQLLFLPFHFLLSFLAPPRIIGQGGGGEKTILGDFSHLCVGRGGISTFGAKKRESPFSTSNFRMAARPPSIG